MACQLARLDSELCAQIVARRPLHYRGGADHQLDRPVHVRAASGLTWVGDRLVVIQDDASFLGVVDPATGLVDDIALPAGADGRRVFDAGLGNKAAKPDLEAAFCDDGTLIALGSGGPLPARRIIVTWRPGEPPRVLDAGRLLDAIAAAVLPGATALNLEGAARIGGHVWIGNRGGDRAGDATSPDAIVTLDAAALRAFLADPAAAPLPTLAVHTYQLGALDGAALHLTDLSPAPGGGALYLAAAEATTSYYDDGAVVGSVVGALTAGAPPRHARVVDATGAPTHDKLEGLTLLPGSRDRALAVIDADDPARPADLVELALLGPWFS